MKPVEMKIYDGETLIHDYTLCEDPQGRIGWYDTICEEFHDQTEQLRSALLKKPEGIQYIDTGVRPEQVCMTNADRIRSMTDEELAAVLDGYGAYSVCDLVCGGKCYAIASLEKTASQKCREIILAKLREPYKEKEHGQTIGVDTEA